MTPQTLLLAIAALIVSLAFTSATAQIPLASDPVTGPNQAVIAPSQPTTRLSLQSATDLLIKNNLSVIAARYNVDILRAQRIAAGLRPRPSITVSATQLAVPGVFQHPANLIHSNTSSAANTNYLIEDDQLLELGRNREVRISQ